MLGTAASAATIPTTTAHAANTISRAFHTNPFNSLSSSHHSICARFRCLSLRSVTAVSTKAMSHPQTLDAPHPQSSASGNVLSLF